MEDQIKPFKDNANFQLLISELLKNQLIMECHMDALKQIFVAMLRKIAPSPDLSEHEKAYKNLVLKAFEHRKENYAAFSPEMTDLILSQLKDLPGLDLQNLK